MIAAPLWPADISSPTPSLHPIGWPSFDKSIDKALTEHVDHKIKLLTEIRCRRCQSHLGHVFSDGPTATGQRYCLNSAAMKFVNIKVLEAEKKSVKKAPPKVEAAEPPAAAASESETKE